MGPVPEAAPIQIGAVNAEPTMAELLAALERANGERDEYRKLYLELLERFRKLEQGILGQKSERLKGNEAQLVLQVLGTLFGDQATADPTPDPKKEKVKEHERAKPTGRKPLPDQLPRVDVEALPDEVKRLGTDAFDCIGEDIMETVERRRGSLVVVRVHKKKFVAKGRDRVESTLVQAPSPELPIPRCVAGPGLLADTIVRRWQDHLPLYRLERVYSRDGLDLARSTICGWHAALAELVNPLIAVMWKDALSAPYLCTDATGVLVQALERCRHAHFWVVVAPERHVLFKYTPKHDGAAVDDCLSGYKGYLVADAASVYEHLYRTGNVIEVGCWAHTRRYFWKSLSTDPERSRHALGIIGALFRIERVHKGLDPKKRLEVRRNESKPFVNAFFEWCDKECLVVLDETPISKGIGYARNQKVALSRFLEDGRLPLHNNISEGQLRREAIGRKNWLFVGNDEGGAVNAAFVSLLASCQLHGIEPVSYLRDLFCLLPSWSQLRLLDLAPASWKKTLEQADTQQRLAANIFRQASLGTLVEHLPSS